MNQFQTCILILVSMSIILKCASELRFCHHGPHKVKDNQCPGGIIFKNPITPKCMFFGSDGLKRNIAPTYNKGICLGTGPDGSITSTADRSGVTIQRINMEKAPTAPAGDLSVPDCTQECLADVMIPPLAEHFDEDLPVRNATEEVLISEGLFDYLTEGEDGDQRGTPGLKIFQVLKEAMIVAQSKCGAPWVSAQFREQTEYALRWMRNRLTWDAVPDIGLHEKEVIIKILRHCKTISAPDKPFEITGTHCANKARIEKISVKNFPNLKYRLEPKSYRWGKFDPFIEAAWAQIDFVRSYCFVDFLPKINHLHLFQQYMESLFIPIIQRRWANPPVFKRGDQYWNILGQVKDLNWTMMNLDFCGQAALKYSPFEQRLDRPFSTPLDNEAQTVTGWSDTIESYWDDYEARGGFETVISRYGICAQSKKEASQYPESIGLDICHPGIPKPVRP